MSGYFLTHVASHRDKQKPGFVPTSNICPHTNQHNTFPYIYLQYSLNMYRNRNWPDSLYLYHKNVEFKLGIKII